MSVNTQSPPTPRRLPVAESPALQTMGEDVPLRTSNEVEGFQYSRAYAVWFSIKALLRLPFLPLWPYFIAKEVKDPSYFRNYFKTLIYCVKVIVDQVRFGSFVRMLRYNLLMSPAQVERRISQRRGACSRCAKCCNQFDCLFLGKDEQGEFFCKVYGTDYWFYGTCGRYPLDQVDIDYHACPGFTFEPAPRHEMVGAGSN
jgi:hypothetical protein